MEGQYVQNLIERINTLEAEKSVLNEEVVWLRERLHAIGELAQRGMEAPPRMSRMEVASRKTPTQGQRRPRDLGDGEMLSKDATKYLGKGAGWLDNDRKRETPRIPYEKRGHRTIVYRKQDIDDFLAQEGDEGEDD